MIIRIFVSIINTMYLYINNSYIYNILNPMSDELQNNLTLPNKQMSKSISINNLLSLNNTVTEAHPILSEKLKHIPPKSINAIHIREIIKNTYKFSNNCSNHECRKKLPIDDIIYVGFDVKFCSIICRDITTGYIEYYWTPEK